MKVRYYARRLFAFVAAVSATTILATSSHAGTVAYLKVDGGAWTAVGPSGNVGALSLGVTGTVVLVPTQVPNQAQLFTATVALTAAAKHDIALVFVSDGPAGGYTSPTAPPAFNVTTAVAATKMTSVTSTDSAVHTFVADGNDSTVAAPGTTGLSGGAPVILGLKNQISPDPMVQGIGTVVNGTIATGSIGNLNSGFTIGQELEFTLGTSTGGGDISLTITTTLAPEPGTMSLFAMGILGFGAYGWRRRRQTKATTETTVA